MKKMLLVLLVGVTLSGCATQNYLEVEFYEPTKETMQTVKINDQPVKVGAARKIIKGNKDGANEFSDNKSFTLSMFNAVGK